MDADGDDASTWLLGGGWDESRWDPPSFPDASWIAEALAETKYPERPVWVLRADAHAGLASHSALAAANVDASASDPPGGSIGRVAGTTRPNGLIRENAIGLITAAIPEPSDARRIAAYHRAFRYLLSLGITSVSDFGDIDALAGSFRKGAAERVWHDFDILESLDDASELPLSVSAYAPLTDWERVRDHAKRGFFADGKNGDGDGSLSRFRVAGCKAFLDGSLGARIAWFQEPYEDDPGNAGEPVCDVDEYEARVVSADADSDARHRRRRRRARRRARRVRERRRRGTPRRWRRYKRRARSKRHTRADPRPTSGGRGAPKTHGKQTKKA